MRIGLKYITPALAAGAAAIAIASAPSAVAFPTSAVNGSDATYQSAGNINGYYPANVASSFCSFGRAGGFGACGAGPGYR